MARFVLYERIYGSYYAGAVSLRDGSSFSMPKAYGMVDRYKC